MKSKWIAIGIVLTILVIIGIVWYRNRKFINKVPVEGSRTAVNKKVADQAGSINAQPGQGDGMSSNG